MKELKLRNVHTGVMSMWEYEDGLFGSDSFMKTEKTKNGDFYDVSSLEGSRPENVRSTWWWG